MSIIKLPLHYEGSQGEKTLETLFDSDISYSCIRFDKVKGLCDLQKLRHNKIVEKGINRFEVKNVVLLDFYINGILLSDEFMVVQNLTEDVIIGDLTMRKWRIKLDYDNSNVIVNPNVAKWILKELPISTENAKHIFRPVRRGNTMLEDLKREQNFQGTDWEKANKWAKSLDIQESAEGLIAQLTK